MKIIFILIILSSDVWAQQKDIHKSIIELTARADYTCMDIKPIGTCLKPNRVPPIGIRLRFWQPEVFMETVKMPGEYTIIEYGEILKSIAQNLIKFEMETSTGIKSLTVTSGSSINSLATSNLQFNEVHLYDFPLDIAFDELCSDSPNQTFGIRYLTEVDSISWRRGDLEKNLPQSLAASVIGPKCYKMPLGAEGQCMKSWGPLYPRQGFVSTSIGSVASIVNSLRAVSIAGDSISGHIVESRLDFKPSIINDKVQMVYPERTQCFPIGQNPYTLEMGKQSKDGHYVWIYWRRRDCCV